MILLLTALIALASLGTVLTIWGANEYVFTAHSIGILCVICASVGLMGYTVSGWYYIAAEHKAEIINREYGTNYTQSEVYWAADVIDTVRELNRKRIEINGDLLNDKHKSELLTTD